MRMDMEADTVTYKQTERPRRHGGALATCVLMALLIPGTAARAGNANSQGGVRNEPANSHVPPRPTHKPDTCAPFRSLGISRLSAYQWRRMPRIGVSIHKAYSITFAIGGQPTRVARRFTINLAVTTAPRTANDLLFLACSGYYSGSQFYRVIASRLLEGGSPPHGAGPGFSATVEGVHGSYVRGAVVMINPASTTEGGRFVVLLGPLTLPARFTIVGTVSHGLDVLQSLSRVPVTVQPDAQEISRPRQSLAITGVSVDVS
jgi:cyclophilin family peptidyl-prolyl cis-trans isomerase